jgi:hypothetical protein
VPIFNSSNQNSGVIIGNAQAKLAAHRKALEEAADLFAQFSGVTQADLSAAPINMPAGDANSLLSAIADAHAEYLIHTTGQPPGTYPQASAAYVYAASQNQVLGVSGP